MKYIVEADERSELVQVISVMPNGTVYTNERSIDELEELNSDYINEHFSELQDTAYQKGLEDGKQTAVGAAELREKLEYQKGFEDGKAQSENGCVGCMWEGNPYYACEQCSNAYKNLWTAKQTDEIKVGDVVEHNSAHDIKVLVTDVDEEEKQFGGLALTTSEHNCDIGDRYSNCQFKRWHKTGRHFDIAKILEDMRND